MEEGEEEKGKGEDRQVAQEREGKEKGRKRRN